MADFVFTEETLPNKMLESLNRLWLKKELCDVILCCGGKEFPCHRNVLASFSSYFEAMFTTGMMESRQERVDMINVEVQAMEKLVRYAYTSEIVISTENVQALLSAAHLLNVTAVQEACCRYMESHMDENNCLGIHCLADTYSCKMLMERSMDSILEHFSVVYQQDEFFSLSLDKLTEILASDDLNVTKEETVFEAAMLWLNHSPDRKQSFEKVMQHIRLALINPSYLDGVKVSLDVVESQTCQRLSEDKKHRPRWSTGPCEVILMVTDHRVVTFHPPTNRWKTLASLPFTSPALVASGSTVYMAGGRYSDGSLSREMWHYDYSCDTWKELAPMHETHTDFALVMLDGYVFAVDRLWDQTVDRYDPNTNSWQLMESVGTMPDLCTGSAVVTLDGVIYATGWDQMYNYNPKTSVWTEAALIEVPRSGSAVCTLNGKIYVIGGQHYEYTNKVECFNPESNQWSTCSSMKKQRYHPGVAVVDGKIYVLGGMNDSLSDLCCIESFNDQTDTWEIVGQMDTGRSCYSCVSLSKR